MSYGPAFLKLIPAQPGWRIASVLRGDDDKLRFEYEPIIAWAEREADPGRLVPVRRDGACERVVYPLADKDVPCFAAFLAILAPGETIDHTSEQWKGRIDDVLHRADEEAQREYERSEARLRGRGTGEDRTEGNG